MNGKYLLDTNIIIALFAGEVQVHARLRECPAIFISAISVGELVYGAHKSRRVIENLSRIRYFVANNTVLHCDQETAYHYGKLKHILQQQGRIMPENDMWIAALTQQHQLTLVSRDKHFEMISEFSLEIW
jgi:tRNA(fMet)-specific endonuclease VapC